jgi:hypothetical protein
MSDDDYPALIAPCLDAENGPALPSFWKEFLGLAYRSGQGPDDEPDFIVINGNDGTPKLAIQAVDSLPRATWPSNDVPAQAHLDLSVRGDRKCRSSAGEVALADAAIRGVRCETGEVAGSETPRPLHEQLEVILGVAHSSTSVRSWAASRKRSNPRSPSRPLPATG